MTSNTDTDKNSKIDQTKNSNTDAISNNIENTNGNTNAIASIDLIENVPFTPFSSSLNSTSLEMSNDTNSHDNDSLELNNFQSALNTVSSTILSRTKNVAANTDVIEKLDNIIVPSLISVSSLNVSTTEHLTNHKLSRSDDAYHSYLLDEPSHGNVTVMNANTNTNIEPDGEKHSTSFTSPPACTENRNGHSANIITTSIPIVDHSFNYSNDSLKDPNILRNTNSDENIIYTSITSLSKCDEDFNAQNANNTTSTSSMDHSYYSSDDSFKDSSYICSTLSLPTSKSYLTQNNDDDLNCRDGRLANTLKKTPRSHLNATLNEGTNGNVSECLKSALSHTTSSSLATMSSSSTFQTSNDQITNDKENLSSDNSEIAIDTFNFSTTSFAAAPEEDVRENGKLKSSILDSLVHTIDTDELELDEQWDRQFDLTDDLDLLDTLNDALSNPTDIEWFDGYHKGLGWLIFVGIFTFAMCLNVPFFVYFKNENIPHIDMSLIDLASALNHVYEHDAGFSDEEIQYLIDLDNSLHNIWIGALICAFLHFLMFIVVLLIFVHHRHAKIFKGRSLWFISQFFTFLFICFIMGVLSSGFNTYQLGKLLDYNLSIVIIEILYVGASQALLFTIINRIRQLYLASRMAFVNTGIWFTHFRLLPLYLLIFSLSAAVTILFHVKVCPQWGMSAFYFVVYAMLFPSMLLYYVFNLKRKISQRLTDFYCNVRFSVMFATFAGVVFLLQIVNYTLACAILGMQLLIQTCALVYLLDSITPLLIYTYSVEQ